MRSHSVGVGFLIGEIPCIIGNIITANEINGAGPDRTYGPNGWPGVSSVAPYSYPIGSLPIPYDPTNGTASDGDIIRKRLSESYSTDSRQAGERLQELALR